MSSIHAPFGLRRASLALAALCLGALLCTIRPWGGAAPTAGASASSHSTSVAHTSAARQTASYRVASPTSASLGPLETIVQSLNNCGPASIAAILAYWHVYRSEAQVAAVMRADNSYWGMSPVHLSVYMRSLGMRALVGYGGSEKLIKLLIANGFPVIASQYVSLADPIRHYRPIEAYNDRTGLFTSADPYLGAGHVISYAEFSAIWGESDGRFQVIYPPSRQARLNAVLKAAGWNVRTAFTGAIRWEEAQMHSAGFSTPGTWIAYNGYPDVAFDYAEMGQYKKAQATLVAATRHGDSQVLIGWVREEIARLQHQAR